MNILNLIIRPNKTRGDRVRVLIILVMGIVLASLAALVRSDAGFIFAESPWVLPTVALTFVVGMLHLSCPNAIL